MIRRAALAAAVVGVLALTGCAGRAAGPATPTPTASTPPAVTLPGETLRAAPVVAAGSTTGRTTALTVLRTAPPATFRPRVFWSAVAPDPAARRLTIRAFESPSTGCGAADEAYVQESATSVIVDLGTRAVDRRRLCPDLEVATTATVTLAAPLGSRTLLEHTVGAVPATPPRTPAAVAGAACPDPDRKLARPDLAGAATRLVPIAVNGATVLLCRWGTLSQGGVLLGRAAVTGSRAAQVITALDAQRVDPLFAHGRAVNCPADFGSSIEAAVTGATGERIEVRVTETGCGGASNGAFTDATASPALITLLRRLTPAA